MSLLPGQILPFTESLGSVNPDKTVTIDKNWWLFLYNLSQQVLGTPGGSGTGLSATSLTAIESNEADADDTDAVALKRIIDNTTLAAMLPDEEVIVSPSPLSSLLLAEAEVIPTSANPSASVGLTAVNGIARTYLTSDSAPALSQAITPTWTGQHIFSGGNEVLITTSGTSLDALGILANGQASGSRGWTVRFGGSADFLLSTGSDSGAANGGGGTAFQATRSGSSVAAVNLGNATANPATNVLGTGLATLNGDCKVVGKSGFNNTAPISKPTVTGSRGGNAALASLLTALANYGLITDSTTA